MGKASVSIRKKSFCFVLALVLVTLALYFLKAGSTKRLDEKLTWEINPVYGKIERSISTTGTVKPQNRLEIKPPIAGRIEQVLVKEGQAQLIRRRETLDDLVRYDSI